MTKEETKKHCELQALWWIASAQTGACKSRKIYHGANGPEFTDEEKVQEALNTAKSHIALFRECCDE